MTNALPTRRAPGLHEAAPDPWITLNRSSSTYFEERAVQEGGVTSLRYRVTTGAGPSWMSLTAGLCHREYRPAIRISATFLL
jgi:hypothetical protein